MTLLEQLPENTEQAKILQQANSANELKYKAIDRQIYEYLQVKWEDGYILIDDLLSELNLDKKNCLVKKALSVLYNKKYMIENKYDIFVVWNNEKFNNSKLDHLKDLF
jgi:hypothetical protein